MLRRISVLLLLACLLPAFAQAATDDPALRYQGTPHDALFDIAFDGSYGLAVGSGGTVLESTDGGRSWAAGLRPDTELALLGVAVEGERRFLVSQSGKIFRYDGAGWSEVETDTDARLFQVALGARGLVVSIGGFGTILVLQSSDRGATWSVVRQGVESIFDFTLNEKGGGIAVGQNGLVLGTSDGGRTWKELTALGETNLLGVWQSGTRAFAVGIRGAYASHDSGKTWKSVVRSDIETGWYQAVASSAPRDKPILVGHGGRILELDE
mgnify:CR=1 FL=1